MTMEYLIHRASDIPVLDESPCKQAYRNDKGYWCIALDSLNTLQGFIDDIGYPIVMRKNSITIYDSYLE